MHQLDPYDLVGITLEDFIERPAWMADALCREPYYQDLPWFPEKGESTDKATNVCARCLCRADCLTYALEHRIDSGIWGGLSPNGRKALRRVRAA